MGPGMPYTRILISPFPFSAVEIIAVKFGEEKNFTKVLNFTCRAQRRFYMFISSVVHRPKSPRLTW
jgi:hypothetical protein